MHRADRRQVVGRDQRGQPRVRIEQPPAARTPPSIESSRPRRSTHRPRFAHHVDEAVVARRLHAARRPADDHADALVAQFEQVPRRDPPASRKSIATHGNPSGGASGRSLNTRPARRVPPRRADPADAGSHWSRECLRRSCRRSGRDTHAPATDLRSCCRRSGTARCAAPHARPPARTPGRTGSRCSTPSARPSVHALPPAPARRDASDTRAPPRPPAPAPASPRPPAAVAQHVRHGCGRHAGAARYFIRVAIDCSLYETSISICFAHRSGALSPHTCRPTDGRDSAAIASPLFDRDD